MGRKVTVELEVPDLADQVDLNPEVTALLVVDLQYEGVHPEAFRKASAKEGLEAVHATAALVERARERGVKVIWLKSVRTPDQPIFTVYGHPPYRMDGTWVVEFVDPLKPLESEPVVKKRTHDCFIHTSMERVLEDLGIMGPAWTFIVTGMSLTSCVTEAVKGLSNRDYRVVVPVDCVAPRTGDRALVSLYQFGQSTYRYNVTPLAHSDGIRFVDPPPVPEWSQATGT